MAVRAEAGVSLHTATVRRLSTLLRTSAVHAPLCLSDNVRMLINITSANPSSLSDLVSNSQLPVHCTLYSTLVLLLHQLGPRLHMARADLSIGRAC